MADGAEKRHAAAMRDGAAILQGRRAGEDRVVLSPLTSFYQEQHNRSYDKVKQTTAILFLRSSEQKTL